MEECFYQVIISGNTIAPIARHEAIASFASLFSLSGEEAAQRFSRAPATVRAGLSREQAEKYCRVLKRLGIECELQPDSSAATSSPGLYPRLLVT